MKILWHILFLWILFDAKCVKQNYYLFFLGLDDSAIENVETALPYRRGLQESIISDENACASPMITPAYHIDKTGAVEDGSLRVLQELCVEKVVGEESFIEVNI